MQHHNRPKTARHVRKHFQLRLRQRYQLHVTNQEWEALSDTCTEDNLLVVESCTRSWHLLNIQGVQVHCLYQWKYGLTTCLTQAAYLESFPPPPEPRANTTLQATASLIEQVLSAAGGKISRLQLQQQFGGPRSLLDSAIDHLKKQGRLMVQGTLLEERQWDLFAA